MTNQIQRMAALQMENQVLTVLISLRNELDKQIDDLRQRMRKVAEL